MKVDIAAVAEAFGMGVTPKAISHRVQKLKKLGGSKTDLGDGEEDGGGETGGNAAAPSSSPAAKSPRRVRKVLKGGVTKKAPGSARKNQQAHGTLAWPLGGDGGQP